MIKYGTNNIGKIFFGGNTIGKAYLGSNLVYDSGSGPGPQPTPYESAQYIETNGNAYLNTGINQASRNFEFTIRLVWVGSTSSLFESFFAYMKNGGVEPRSGLHKYQGNWMFGTNATKKTSVVADNNIHTFTVSGNATTQEEKLYIDGNLVDTATTASTGLAGNAISFFLGCRNRNGSVDNPCYARFYSLNYKIFNDAAHTSLYQEFDYIPVRYNGVFGMWETLTDTFKSSISGTDFSGQLNA